MANKFAMTDVSHRMRGYSLLELTIVGVIACFLFGVVMVRYASMQAASELVARDNVLAALRTALVLKASEIAFQEGAGRVKRLERENPFSLLSGKPDNYAGEILVPDALLPGQWGYATNNNVLYFYPRWTSGSFPRPSNMTIYRYRIVVRFGAGGSDGVVIEQVAQHQRGQ